MRSPGTSFPPLMPTSTPLSTTSTWQGGNYYQTEGSHQCTWWKLWTLTQDNLKIHLKKLKQNSNNSKSESEIFLFNMYMEFLFPLQVNNFPIVHYSLTDHADYPTFPYGAGE